MIIIYWLAEEPMHFAGLRRRMSGISQKVLTEQLRELQADGLVHRRAADGPAQTVIYSLTPLGLLAVVARRERASMGPLASRAPGSPLSTHAPGRVAVRTP